MKDWAYCFKCQLNGPKVRVQDVQENTCCFEKEKVFFCNNLDHVQA